MVKNVKQKDLRSMFSPKPDSIKPNIHQSDFVTDSNHIEDRKEDEPASKRLKITNESNLTGNFKRKSTVKPLKCDICKQLLGSEALKIFNGDDSEASEEFIALASDALSLFDADSNCNGDAEWNDRPQHRITNFTVYDEYGHLCPFDTGLIDQNIHLYFSGYIKPIYDDSLTLEGGAAGTKLGPIDAWYIAGFDGGERELIGFTTMYADYILSQPSEQYSDVFDTLREKTFLSKTVIEILEENAELTIEDLINEIQLVVPPENCPKFSEESLLKHAQFLVEQIESYDRAADADEDFLITIPAVRGLIKLAGVTLGGAVKQPNKQHRVPKPNDKAQSKTKSTDTSHATVTPLIQASFEGIFIEQMQDMNRKKRCNDCEVCKAADCGECVYCKDMTKFGGSGKRRQACENRKCPSMVVKEAEENSGDETYDQQKKKSVHGGAHKAVSANIDAKFTGQVAFKKGKKCYYSSAEVEGATLEPGDYVTIAPDTKDIPDYVGRIVSLFSKGGLELVHVHWLCGPHDTVLGDAHDKTEVFLSDLCDDVPLGSVIGGVEVKYNAPDPNWNMSGGMEVSNKSHKGYHYKFWYDPEKARFEDALPDYLDWSPKDQTCPACMRRNEADRASIPALDDQCCVLSYKHVTYHVGDYVYIKCDAYSLPTRYKNTASKVRNDKVEDDIFPEYYRKSDYIKGNNDLVPEPYRIGRVVSFSRIKASLDSASVRVSIKKMYRPENIENCCMDTADINILFYSNDQIKISADMIEGKCTVKHSDDIVDLMEFTTKPDHFYVSELWNSSTKSLVDVPNEARSSNKGKKKKLDVENAPSQFKKLRTLDVFAGCGGLSEGFHQAGVAESCWAIEFFSEAARAYKLNNPNAVVFNEDCNKVLQMAIDGVTADSFGQKIPQKGEVELLCGGPPCQGFSGMNRFNAREYSMFKNSLISSYLSYCEFYRPRYFLLENVRNFVSYKKNMVLKLCLSSLVNMGYQCTFGVLQAGSYGVAQTRRRAFLLAAAPGEVLPSFPEPRHVFSPKAMSLNITIDEKQYKSHITRYDSAPLRNITVRDIMSDLPAISNGANKRELPYDSGPLSWFQRKIRGNTATLTDHICKEMNPLVAMRMRHIPLTPGSDWRDLPNINVTLSDGSKTFKLVYTHNDLKNGPMKGICSCAEGKKCEPMDKQTNTLIPWCLPHTGNRHNNWAGLYGRVFWDGFFSTTITNPEPMGKQGRVLHPEQHRLVSVRECARSQGFPDSYKFYGTLLDKHRQVGNAVPPPLARAIGDEIKKSLITVEHRNKCKHKALL